MSSLLLILLAVELVLPMVLFLGRSKIIFLPSARPLPAEGRDWIGQPEALRLVEVERPDGRRLAAYDVRAPEGSRPVVLFFHGNAGNLAMRAPLALELALGLEARILMIDYSGYGGNAGSPSEAEVVRDGLAAYDHLRAEGVEAQRIVLFGESLGGAVALAVAAERPVAGVVVQSTFSSLASMAWRLYPLLPLVAVLARNAMPNGDRAAALEVPLLIVHGEQDRIIPYAEGDRLHRLAGEHAELLTIPGAGHNDLFAVGGAGYLQAVGERLASWVAMPGSDGIEQIDRPAGS